MKPPMGAAAFIFINKLKILNMVCKNFSKNPWTAREQGKNSNIKNKKKLFFSRFNVTHKFRSVIHTDSGSSAAHLHFEVAFRLVLAQQAFSVTVAAHSSGYLKQ